MDRNATHLNEQTFLYASKVGRPCQAMKKEVPTERGYTNHHPFLLWELLHTVWEAGMFRRGICGGRLNLSPLPTFGGQQNLPGEEAVFKHGKWLVN